MKAEKAQRAEKTLDFVKIGAIIQKNFLVLKRDKLRLLPLIIFPLIMILIFGYISGNIPKHIPSAVVAYDNSQYSQRMQQEISNSEVLSVKYVVSSEDEAKRLLDEGKIRIVIEIPPNFGSNIDKNIQSEITVIVDESDSAVGSTAKQTLNQIINTVSNQIAAEKLIAFQKSVDRSADQIVQNSQQQNNYKVISKNTESALSSVEKSKKAIEETRNAILTTIVLPRIVIGSSTNEKEVNYTNTYLIEPKSNALFRAEVALQEQALAQLNAASHSLNTANSVAEKSSDAIDSSQNSVNFENNIKKPIESIKVFTTSKGDGILHPVVYKEKPAYGTGKRAVDFLIPSIIALTIFQGAVMNMGRSIAGERGDGSLTRVFLTPTSNATIILGTLSFYVLFELFRSAFVVLIAMLVFGLKIEGSILLIGLILVIYAAISTGIGLILSSGVKTEQQYMGLAILVSLPAIFLSGALFPLQAMPKFLQILAGFLPVTYAAEALRGVMVKGFPITLIIYPLAILLIFLAVILFLVFTVFRRNIE